MAIPNDSYLIRRHAQRIASVRLLETIADNARTLVNETPDGHVMAQAQALLANIDNALSDARDSAQRGERELMALQLYVLPADKIGCEECGLPAELWCLDEDQNRWVPRCRPCSHDRPGLGDRPIEHPDPNRYHDDGSPIEMAVEMG